MASAPPIRTDGLAVARGIDTAPLDGAVGFWLRLGQQQDLRRFNRTFTHEGASQLVYSLLLLIEANPRCRQADLGAALHIRQPNLVEPIEGLIARGSVQRRPDPEDRRAQTLELTAEGETLLARLRAAHDALIEGYRERLGSEDYERLVGLLRRFVAVDERTPAPLRSTSQR